MNSNIHTSFFHRFDRLIAARTAINVTLASQGLPKLSYLPFVLKACSLALNSYPELNAHFSESDESLIVRGCHDFNVAVATPAGLVVPIIRNIQAKSILDINVDLQRLIDLARVEKLAPDDLKLGTFTFSNIGSIAGTVMKPVILPPQVMIGALGAFHRVPKFTGTNTLEIEEAHVGQLSLSADHRCVDGATAALFSTAVKNLLEQPSNMLINLK